MECIVVALLIILLIRDNNRLDQELLVEYQKGQIISQVFIEKNEVETVSQSVDVISVSESDSVAPVQFGKEKYYDNLEELAVCVEAEAGNQSLEGRRMVVAVILNRVDAPEFPNTVKDVIEQKGHFTSFWDGNMARIKEPSELSIQAVQLELKERKYKTILFFRGGHYSKYGTPAWKFEDHYFSTR